MVWQIKAFGPLTRFGLAIKVWFGKKKEGLWFGLAHNHDNDDDDDDDENDEDVDDDDDDDHDDDDENDDDDDDDDFLYF